mmetsp:Transcript_14517/g.27310  ORF Transcript_14517/g.27310 Transcript_14517/m.27310 type:complete len:269 (+) Transcript_14517:288-1094(+)
MSSSLQLALINPMRHPTSSSRQTHHKGNNNKTDVFAFFSIKKKQSVPPQMLLLVFLLMSSLKVSLFVSALQQAPSTTMAVGAFMFHTPKSSASTNRRLVVASNQPVTKCEGIEQEHQHQHRQPQLLYQQRAITRRDTLSAIAVAIACGISTTRPSAAAPPMTAKEADGLSFRFERQFRRIPPAKLLRPMLNLDFAVLLMRSSYNAVDELNFVPMDQFQRDFLLSIVARSRSCPTGRLYRYILLWFQFIYTLLTQDNLQGYGCGSSQDF